ncbi:MAG TPA: NAD(P)/FAD-dependent oxidoreductase [Niabella sp.]|nr:NAD(P)/FAD-dependent oxidoreductase [Niabella sp.]HOZ95561.1 NAD(P)/FAD-dependent oxidoreductase [Niabella sp.]HQW13801.1 NAD(P)/FAD-dependent oxidoreductase [Niabella sp.]HQX19306.1 NAD(P)/FAD-dependent oxidoreductase [Niabella sp.]HQX40838.1 NAD(P)/FAD-dependent oxidoreductase [Niabella sp.]
MIGGGAAGFFCAINAAQMNPDLGVTILEKSGKLLSKVKVSGGGRCNVTHACFEIGEMVKRYPRGGNFVRKLFHQFFTTDTIEWFKNRNVLLKQEADGRMFPMTDTSQTIINCLLKETASSGIDIRMNTGVESIEKVGDRFVVLAGNHQRFEADFVCVACGGFPKTSMFEWLLKTGHSIAAPVPSLFTFNLPKHPITQLMGVSVHHAVVKIVGSKQQQQGPVLITHWGLSAPAVLKLSAYAARELADKQWQFEILVNWLPEYNEQSLKEQFLFLRQENGSYLMYHKNPFGLPNRLWDFFLNQCQIPKDCRRADLSAKHQNELIKKMTAYLFEVKGKTTFKEEFVTAGGIIVSEIDAHTMMSKKVPNLFFAGEVIDVDGVTGGFNFQNAWSTGWVAAKAISKLLEK